MIRPDIVPKVERLVTCCLAEYNLSAFTLKLQNGVAHPKINIWCVAHRAPMTRG